MTDKHLKKRPETGFKGFFKKLARWDANLCVKASKLHGRKSLDRVMTVSSHLGDGFAYPFVALGIYLFDSPILRPFSSVALASFSLELSAYGFTKLLVRRRRPSAVIPQLKNRLRFPDRFSFPSGHAAAAFLMATLLLHFYPASGVPCYTAASLISVSRVYNGLHYPSDIVFGSALGYASARLGMSLVL